MADTKEDTTRATESPVDNKGDAKEITKPMEDTAISTPPAETEKEKGSDEPTDTATGKDTEEPAVEKTESGGATEQADAAAMDTAEDSAEKAEEEPQSTKEGADADEDEQPEDEGGDDSTTTPSKSKKAASSSKSKSLQKKKSVGNLNKRKSVGGDVTFHEGMFVLARLKGYPPWPAVIVDEELIPEAVMAKKPKESTGKRKGRISMSGLDEDQIPVGARGSTAGHWPVMFLDDLDN